MKAKREGRLKLDLPFEEAIRRAVQVKPPAQGWGLTRKKAKPRLPAKKVKQAA